MEGETEALALALGVGASMAPSTGPIKQAA